MTWGNNTYHSPAAQQWQTPPAKTWTPAGQPSPPTQPNPFAKYATAATNTAPQITAPSSTVAAVEDVPLAFAGANAGADDAYAESDREPGPLGHADAALFNLPPAEVLAMDPGHRLLVEASLDAASRACGDPSTLARSRTVVVTAQFQNDIKRLVKLEAENARYSERIKQLEAEVKQIGRAHV